MLVKLKVFLTDYFQRLMGCFQCHYLSLPLITCHDQSLVDVGQAGRLIGLGADSVSRREIRCVDFLL